MSRGQLLEKLQSEPCVLLLATGEHGHPWAVLVACQHHLQQRGESVGELDDMSVIGGACVRISPTHT